MLLLEGHCRICGEQWRLLVNEQSYKEWEEGKLIQKAFPDMPADERELIMNSVCDSCFSKVCK